LQDGHTEIEWQLPEEVPVALRYNGETFAVMLATPLDLEDFARGFSLTEGIIEDEKEIVDISSRRLRPGIELRISILEKRAERIDLRHRVRSLAGRSSCGLCGLTDFAAFEERLPPVAEEILELDPVATVKAARAFKARQPLKQENRSVHGAAFVHFDGEIVMVREDIGRHNALDKLIGALMAKNISSDEGFLLISSRCSYEMVQKAARWGARAVVALSSATSLAVEIAADTNIALAIMTDEGGFFIPQVDSK
jgi:formate dehydrogenase accessory protein FdhD